ncbi:MAG TPA: hypothetical protein VG734_03370 [Lacunisphaera sp.]|nr:hypothetical protein [Lacunisphaera sp.]
MILVATGCPVILPAADSESPSEKVAKVLAQPPSRERNRELREAVRAWAAIDARSALAAMQQLPRGFEQQQLVNAVLWEWALHEPVAAAEVAWGFPPERRSQSEALVRVVQSWAGHDPRGARAWVDKLPAGPERFGLTLVAVDGWGRIEPEAAAAFALEQPPGRERTMLRNTVLKAWLSKDAAAAWAFAKALTEESDNPQLLQELLDDWGNRDPAAALGRIDELPDAGSRQLAQMTNVGRLAEKDAAKAIAYLNAMPAGNVRDETVLSFVRLIEVRSPELAVEWVLKIGDPKFRAGAAAEIAGRWLDRDRAAAERRMAKPDFPPEIRERLLSPGR